MTARTRFLSLVLPLLASAGAWAAGETSSHVWTLREASRHATDQAITSRIAAETLLGSEAGEAASFARLFPELKFDSAHAWNYRKPPGNDFWTSHAGLTASANIYDNGQRWTNWQLSKLVLEDSKAATERDRQRAIYDLADAWLDYSYQLEAWVAEREQFELLERQYRSTEQQNRQGLRTQQDVLRIRIPFQKTQLSLESAGEGILSARRKLSVLMNLEVAADAKLPAPNEKVTGAELGRRLGFEALDLSKLPKDLPAITAGNGSFAALERRSLRLQTEQAELTRERESRALWPELSVSASGGYGTDGYLFPESNAAAESAWQASAVVNLNWSIWDFGARRADVRAAGARARLAQLNEKKKDLDAVQREADLRLELARLNRQSLQTEELRRMEETNYAYLAARYREGKVSYLDLIDGLKSLLSSRLSFIQVSRDLRARAAQLAFEEGRIHETIDRL